MRSLVLFAISALISAFTAQAAEKIPMKLTYSAECILEAISKRKNVTLRSDIPVPLVHLESVTPLKQFQDAVEPQWKMRPDVFLNAYIVRANEIYLIDDSAYYNKVKRFVDDSLAHELTHFLQVKYQGAELDGNDESLEIDAVEMQTWFREEFMKTGKSPCAGN